MYIVRSCITESPLQLRDEQCYEDLPPCHGELVHSFCAYKRALRIKFDYIHAESSGLAIVLDEQSPPGRGELKDESKFVVFTHPL